MDQGQSAKSAKIRTSKSFMLHGILLVSVKDKVPPPLPCGIYTLEMKESTISSYLFVFLLFCFVSFCFFHFVCFVFFCSVYFFLNRKSYLANNENLCRL